MTTWVETPRKGRDHGLAGILRAWVAVVVRPRQLSRDGIVPGGQAPDLVFVITVAPIYQSLEFAFEPTTIPAIEGGPLVSALVAPLVVALFVAPALLRLTAAIQTAPLIPLLSRRARVSKTVQVIAYAAAPRVFANLPTPGVRALCTVYGMVFLVVGTSGVHQTTTPKVILAAAVPAGVVFGYAFGDSRVFPELATAFALV